MKTTQEQRKKLRHTYGGFSEEHNVFLDLLEDLDTQETELTKLRKRVEVLQKALEKYALPQTRLTKKYEEEQWRLEPGFHDPQPAIDALKESAR